MKYQTIFRSINPRFDIIFSVCFNRSSKILVVADKSSLLSFAQAQTPPKKIIHRPFTLIAPCIPFASNPTAVSVASIDNFKDFENRFFVDKNHPSNFKYKSFFGVGSENGALKDGRMVGRTRFFLQNSDGSITYPSNHYITSRTSKDVLNNLIYKGTQHIGKNPTRDPINNDPFPNSPAYIIDVGGSDTVTRIRVDRPVSRDLRNITLNIMGRSAGEVTFTLLKGRETVLTQNLHTTGDTAPREITVSFAQTGEPKGYSFTVNPTGTNRVRDVRVIPVNDRRNASINADRNRDNGVDGRFTAIRGDFALRIDLV